MIAPLTRIITQGELLLFYINICVNKKPHVYKLHYICTNRTIYLLAKINIEFNDDCPAN